MKVTIQACSKSQQEKEWPQIVAIIIGGLAGLTSGLLFAWPSPFAIKIVNDTVHYNITEEEASYFSTLQPIAFMVTAPVVPKLADIIGRKSTLLLISIPHVASWMLSLFAKSVYVFYAARICSGFADTFLFSVLPVYIGEIANPKIRGTWGNVITFSLYIGELLINIVGSYVDVKTTSYIFIFLPFLFIICFSLMPETPYFYVMQGNEEKAKDSLRFLKRVDNINNIYAQLESDVRRQVLESGTWCDLFKISSNRKSIIAAIFLRTTQQLSGFSVFLTYTQFIFQKSGGNITHELASIVYLAICVIFNLLGAILIVPRFSRKTCFMVSAFCCSIVLFIMSLYYFIDDKLDVNIQNFNWIPVTGLVLYQVCASFGIAVIPVLMLSELFSASIKDKALTVFMIASGLSTSLASFIFYELNITLGFYSPFCFFAMCCAIASVLSKYIVPETKGKSLEEIQQELKST